MTFHADAGTTYYVQVLTYGRGSLQFALSVAPAPSASFYFWPNAPSSFDTVSFFDNSNDPGQAGWTEAWNLGDGTSATGNFVNHRYLADGDYTVKLTITTTDGRSASTSQVVHVRTHDVAIAKFSVPQSASAGQTRSIVVGISNKRYPEMVQVQLYRSNPSAYGGYDLIGTLQQSVPVRGGGRTTDFGFSYTFTSADKSLGKVTFKAVATIVGANDALPADNEAVALPTRVG